MAGGGALALAGSAGVAIGAALGRRSSRRSNRGRYRRRYYRRGRREAELTPEEQAEDEQIEALFYRASQLDSDSCFRKLICELVASNPEKEVKLLEH